mgnify:CR=1 FL=1
MFSSTIIMENDFDGNYLLDQNEIKSIEANAFSNLSNFDYFLHIKINGSRYLISTVKDFTAEIADHKLIYNFFISRHINIHIFP